MWAIFRKNRSQSLYRRGFTIVELLIVIVVIAILAAITIVAYNGIQNRAKSSAAQSAVSQASRKIISYAAINSDTYPTTPTEAGLTNDGTTSYQLTVNNSATPKTYCVTATTGTTTYWISSTSAKPTLGACPGHGVGGVAPVTNYFLNPRFDGPDLPLAGTGTSASITSCGGSTMAVGVTNTTGSATIRLSSNQNRLSVTAGQTIYLSVDVYNASSGPRLILASLRFYDTEGTTLGGLLQTDTSTIITLAAGAGQTLTASGTAPAGALSVGVNINRNTNGSALSGDTYCADNVYLSTALSGFGDGNTSGWAWNGTPNNATSSGPPQP